MSPELDPAKDAVNILKHGVSLSDGDGVLADPMALTIEDQTSRGEARYVTLGMNVFGALMVVVWTERNNAVRFISVRKAAPKERQDYEG